MTKESASTQQLLDRVFKDPKTEAKGRPIPGTDAQIAAVARLHGLVVLSSDRHLRYVDNLRVESWL